MCRAMLVTMPEITYSLAMVAMADCHKTRDINTLHKKLGHVSKALMQKTTKFYGWELKNLFETCKICALTKS